ncbi:MAG: type II toxin-antitoxin system RelE/ParE family toxin [Patescibacteria group bacterium]|nr:type II toxin-antitoxin system RelE/ParE family toxin [Patescibacteria group bacterium]
MNLNKKGAQPKFRILFVDDSINKFITKLEKGSIAKVLKTIDLLEKFNFKLGLPHSKKIDKKLFELRVYGRQKIRIFYIFQGEDIILLHIFIKKTTKIPARELKVINTKLQKLN